MRGATTAGILVATLLCGCGGGGTPVEEKDPVVALGNLFLERELRFGTTFDVLHPFFASGATSSPVVALFETLAVTESDSGRTFVVASPADDPDFGPMVAMLTNGVDDNVRVVFPSSVGPGSIAFQGRESLMLEDAAGPLALDFAGSTITRIELRLVDLRFDSPGQDDDGNGNGTDVAVTLRIVFFGVRN